MKTQNKFVLVTLTAITTLFITQAGAQYRTVGDDGIAASPKVRQMLDERKLSSAQAPAATAACCRAAAGKATATASKPCGQCCERGPQQAQAAPGAPVHCPRSAGFIRQRPRQAASLPDKSGAPGAVARCARPPRLSNGAVTFERLTYSGAANPLAAPA